MQMEDAEIKKKRRLKPRRTHREFQNPSYYIHFPQQQQQQQQ